MLVRHVVITVCARDVVLGTRTHTRVQRRVQICCTRTRTRSHCTHIYISLRPIFCELFYRQFCHLSLFVN